MSPGRPAPAPAAFTGFGEQAIDFYDGLAADNSRAYWQDHREVYDEHVRGPMQALLDAVEPEFGTGKVYRPYRDLRYTTDKTPYKTHCGAQAGPHYVQIGPEGMLAASGYYHLAADQLARYRAAVDDERIGAELARLLDRVDGGLVAGGEVMARGPRGADPDHPRFALLRRRALYLWRQWPPDDVLHSAGALRRVRRTWRAAGTLVAWLADHVGPSELPRR